MSSSVTKTRMRKTKARAIVEMDKPADREFLELLAVVGDDRVVQGQPLSARARSYTPDDIEARVISGTVGALLAAARHEAKRSLAVVGEHSGVTRARIQQIEHSENVEVSTLVRIAAACGYDVDIRLRPMVPGRPPLSAVLRVATG